MIVNQFNFTLYLCLFHIFPGYRQQYHSLYNHVIGVQMLQQAVVSYKHPIAGTNMTDKEALVMFHHTTKEIEKTFVYFNMVYFNSLVMLQASHEP